MRYEPRVREFLNSWQLWMGIAWLGIVAVVVGLIIVRNTALTAQAEIQREASLHHAEVVATGNAAYNSCVQSIPTLRRISTHLLGVNEIARAAVENARAIAVATPRSDPEYGVRHRNYERIRAATAKVAAVQKLPVPNRDDCSARRRAVMASGGIR